MGLSAAALAGGAGPSFQPVCLCRPELGRTSGQMERCPPGKRLPAPFAHGTARWGGHAGCALPAGLCELLLCSCVPCLMSREDFFLHRTSWKAPDSSGGRAAWASVSLSILGVSGSPLGP